MDPRMDRMAEVLVNYSMGVRRGDWVVIETSPLGEPLALACARKILEAGGNTSFVWDSDELTGLVLHEGNTDQIQFISPMELATVQHADVLARIRAPINTRALSSVDPSHVALQRRAAEQYQEIYHRRVEAGALRWVITQYPTAAAAQDAGMSLREYEDFVFCAALVDEPDPVAAWKHLAACQADLIEWLHGKETIHVEGPGTDLTVSVAGRTWINSDGKHNFPSGEIFTGPVEDGTEGVVRFTYPAYLRGQEVTGVCLVFERGRVVEATAASNEAFLHEMLALDEGARCLGEFALGTNAGIQKFTRNTLFDEKIGGTLHMALGQAYPDSGGVNQSMLHWDMVYDLRSGGEVTVDGEPFSRDGRFLV